MKSLEIHNLSNVAEIKITYSHKANPSNLPKISSCQDANELLKLVWDMDTIELVETFKCIYLNRANRVLGIVDISTGGMNSALADPARIFSPAIVANAHAIILAHNHPSGTAKPSKADIQLTDKIKKGGEILSIPVLDHLIITKESYYSMAENMDM